MKPRSGCDYFKPLVSVMKIIAVFLLAIVTLTQLGGCATALSQSIANEEDTRWFRLCSVPRVYSGTALDVCVLTKRGNPLGLTDLPFSLIADTVVLPYTIYSQYKRGNIFEKEMPCSEPKADNPLPTNPVLFFLGFFYLFEG